MNELNYIEKLLLDIENLTEEEKQKLKKMIAPYYSINTNNDYMTIYNKMNTTQLKILFELVGINVIYEDFITKITDKSKLPIIPYNFDSSNYYKAIFKDYNIAKSILSNPNFYLELTDILDIESLFKYIETEDLKKIFVSNCLEYQMEAILFGISYLIRHNKTFIEYLPNDKIIKKMQEQEDSDEILQLYSILDDKNKISVYKAEWFKNKVDTNIYHNRIQIIENSPDELIEELLNENKKIGTIALLEMFYETRKVIFLKKFLEQINLKELKDEHMVKKIIETLFSITEKNFNILGDYQDKLINFINEIPDNIYIKLYFKEYMTFKHQSIILKSIMYKKAKNILENNTLIIDEISLYILKNQDESILDLIKNNTPKETLLLLSIRNEYINRYVLELLISDPTYFDGTNITNIDKYPMIIKKGNQELMNKFLLISNYLDKEQLKIYFIPFFIQKDKNIRDYYIEDVKKNPDFLASFEDLSLFKRNEIKTIIQNINIKKLMDLILYKRFKPTEDLIKIVRENLNDRIYDIAKFVNDDDNNFFITRSRRLDKISYFFQKEDTNLLISLIDNYHFLCYYLREVQDNTIIELVTSRLVQLYNNDIDIDFFTETPHFFKDENEKEQEFFDKLSFEVLISMACNSLAYSDTNSKEYKKYINYITKRIDKDINVLFTINVITKLDELLTYLPNDYQNKIKTYIDDNYNLEINKYPIFKQYITTYTDKANFVIALTSNLINNSNYNYVLELLSKNKFLFNSMNFNLLNPNIMKMGKYFIDKTSRYPVLASKLIKISEEDKKKYDLICRLSNKIRLENNDTIYDIKIETIINYLLKNNIEVNKELTDKILHNVENYILEESLNKNYIYKQLSIINYIEDKNNMLDNQISSCNDLNELKNLIYQRNFGLTQDSVEAFLIGYATNWNSVENLCNTRLPSEFIKELLNIKNTPNIDALKNNINNIREYTISDFLKVKGIMIDTYNKSIVQDIKQNNNSIKRKINIGNEFIEVEDLTDDFSLLVHSTNAYGSMPLINDNYYDSWNYNPNTKNHGICTSYITNSSYGTPHVKNDGVMFGFTNIDEFSVPIYAPYDLMTGNDGYTIKSCHKPFFGRLKTISNYTRHTHNEFTLERRINNKNNNLSLRQPDCIVIFEDMSDNIKENSIKAYKDFKNAGIDLKLVYIDRVKNSTKEACKLNILINEYQSTYNLQILEQIINLYESNICGCDFLGTGRKGSKNLFEQHELFQTNRIKELLFNTLDYIETIEDTATREIMLINFINILNNEQFKFDLINDLNTERKHTFDLYDTPLKMRVEKLIKTSNINNTKPKSL